MRPRQFAAHRLLEQDVALGIHQGNQVIPRIVEVLRRHRAAVTGNQRHILAERGDPGGHLGRIGDGRRQADQAHRRRGQDDGLFPRRAAFRVGQIVHLVKHDRRNIAHVALEQHVAVDFGGHDDDGRARVLHQVARHQTDGSVPILGAEVAELLVRQGFEGSSVDHALPVAHGRPHGVLGDDGLAGAGRGGDEDRLPPPERLDGVDLEGVQGEGITSDKLLSGHSSNLSDRNSQHLHSHVVIVIASASASLMPTV